MRYIWLLLCTACSAPYAAQSPQGFASFDDDAPFRAVNTDGILYQVRHEDNEPEAELTFWREALKKRMQDAGYRVLGESEIKSDKHVGHLLELAAPVGQADYAYLVAIYVHDDDIVIAEAAGEVTKVQAQKENILQAMRSIELR